MTLAGARSFALPSLVCPTISGAGGQVLVFVGRCGVHAVILAANPTNGTMRAQWSGRKAFDVRVTRFLGKAAVDGRTVVVVAGKQSEGVQQITGRQ